MLVSSGENLVGVRPDKVPGQDLREKRKHLYQMTVDDLKKLVDADGFYVEVDAGCAIMVPSGFLVITASVGSRGIRWSTSSDENDTTRVKHGVEKLLEAFPETRNASTGYAPWLKWLQAD